MKNLCVFGVFAVGNNVGFVSTGGARVTYFLRQYLLFAG